MEINELKEGMRVVYPKDQWETCGSGTLEMISKAGGNTLNGTPYVWCYVKFDTPRSSGQLRCWWPSNRLGKA